MMVMVMMMMMIIIIISFCAMQQPCTLPPEDLSAFPCFLQEYSSSLDLAEMSDLCAWITRESNHQNPQLQVSLSCNQSSLLLSYDKV